MRLSLLLYSSFLFRREKFSLEFSHEVEYNVGEAGAGILNKDNIALIAGLSSAASGAQFLLATTHLLFRSVISVSLPLCS